MTRQKSFKRLVRSRMQTTGESYTAARAMLLAADESATTEGPPLATSDEAIRQRTGRGWEQWFDLLDDWGAAELAHKEIARRVAAELAIEPLAWNAQAITVSYERARGLRVVGERTDGFAVTAQRTVAAPVQRLFDAFVDSSLRRRWLPQDELRERTATKAKSARFDWGDGDTRVNVTFLEKADGKSTVAVEHARLADAGEAVNLIVAAVAAFVSGGTYYALCGEQLAQVSDAAAAGAHPAPWKLVVELLRCLIIAAVVAGLASQGAIDEWTGGLLLGLALWIGFPFVLWTGAVLHENTPWQLAVIHAGDWLVKLLVVAVIVTVWQ